jgi:Protein of unknown function (DUF3298)
MLIQSPSRVLPMPDQKQRVEIPEDIAAEILFLSDRTCCVCRERRKPIQLHHIDDDPSNSAGENLAVLCFDCHRDTQIRGGFDRKLNSAQVMLYKSDWLVRVEAKRGPKQTPIAPLAVSEQRAVRYLQLKEKSEEHLYEFEADYALISSGDPVADSEVNLCINAFITRKLQRFRIDAMRGADYKREMRKSTLAAAAWDGLSLSHKVSLFTEEVLSLEFQVSEYGAGAAHPNHHTETMNFRLRPSMQLALHDVFKYSSNYLDVLSAYCVEDLHKQQPQRWADSAARSEQLRSERDEWIARGAAPENLNFERLSLLKQGVVVHFDPYQVDCYAAGKYEVFVPAYELKSIICDDIAALLGWC